MHNNSKPLGKLIAIGGAEDKGHDLDVSHLHLNNGNYIPLGILKRIIQEAKGTSSQIEVITTASMIPDEVAGAYLEAFSKLKCDKVAILDIRKPEDVLKTDFIERIKNADIVMFSGGDQSRLSHIFNGTEIHKILLKRYHDESGFVIAGTSAGAMAMSLNMIFHGDSSTAHLKGEVKLSIGLGFVENLIIDSHFEKRGRFNRLSQAVAAHPGCLGIGLGEDTGILITGGDHMEAIGSGPVIVIDAREIKYSNYHHITDGNPISLENLIVHVMVQGTTYTVRHGLFQAAPMPGSISYN